MLGLKMQILSNDPQKSFNIEFCINNGLSSVDEATDSILAGNFGKISYLTSSDLYCGIPIVGFTSGISSVTSYA